MMNGCDLGEFKAHFSLNYRVFDRSALFNRNVKRGVEEMFQLILECLMYSIRTRVQVPAPWPKCPHICHPSARCRCGRVSEVADWQPSLIGEFQVQLFFFYLQNYGGERLKKTPEVHAHVCIHYINIYKHTLQHTHTKYKVSYDF